MRSPRRTALHATLSIWLAAAIAGIASAEPVVVIRGSDVATVDPRDAKAGEERSADVPAESEEPTSEPDASASTADEPQAVAIDVQDFPEAAWDLVSPWEETGIKVHRVGSPPEPSRIRVHRSQGSRP
jgi:hypothetical protein